MRKIAGPLRLNLAQFRELAAFAEFGSELDASSLAQLERGRRVVEVLKQPQFAPVSVEEQVLVLFAVTEGHMDDIPTEDVRRFERQLREYFRGRHGNLLQTIAETGKMPEGDEMVEGIREFKQTFEASGTGE
jgi:F-type H+-transporting ATPase subunit alpha